MAKRTLNPKRPTRKKAARAKIDLSHIEPALHGMVEPVADLAPDAGNVRTHSERNVELIQRSLDGFKQQTPIVVDAAGVVRKGNGTLQAAIAMGWTHIAVVRSSLKGKQASAYAVADNRTGDADVGSAWDRLGLHELLTDLQSDDSIDHTLTGFDDNDIALLAELGDGDALDTEPQLDGLEFRVVVDTDGEQHQKQLLERFKKEGLKCRALIS